MREDLRMVERLRTLRVHPARDTALSGPIAAAAAALAQRARQVGALGAAWAELAPPGMVERTHLVGVRRGVLTIRCADSSTRFEVDRWLRGGGEVALIVRSGARLTRVKSTL